MNMVMVKAVRRGTVVHETGNYHVDPDSPFKEAKQRPVPAAVAAELEQRGLAKILSAKVVYEDADASTIAIVAAERAKTALEERGEGPVTAEVGQVLGTDGMLTTFATTHTEQDRLATASTPQSIISVRGTREPEALDRDGEEDEDGAPGSEDEGDDAPSGIITDAQIAELGSSAERRAAKKKQTRQLAAKAKRAAAVSAPPEG